MGLSLKTVPLRDSMRKTSRKIRELQRAASRWGRPFYRKKLIICDLICHSDMAIIQCNVEIYKILV